MSNIEIIVKKLIDIYVKDADVYVNNGSLWLIFTEEKKWVIELDNAGNLWYNYHFFYKTFKLISMNVVENQHYITRWVEDVLQNGVKHTSEWESESKTQVEDALQNGIKQTSEGLRLEFIQVEDVLQNGVKGTRGYVNRGKKVEDTVQNGIKHTVYSNSPFNKRVKDTIQNGVKETRWMSDWEDNKVEDTIQNGVKSTKIQELDTWDIQKCRVKEVEDIIQNVVKDTKNLQWMKTTLIEDTVQNGVKI